MISRGRILAAMTAILAMVFIDQTVVAVALPSIRADLELSTAEFQWVVSGYLLAVAAFAITGGRISDRLGHPRGAALALAVFLVGSLASGAATSGEWLIAARVLQGLGGGVLTSSCVAIVSDAYPEEHRGKALGIYWGVAGLALALGPLVGGIITDALSWRWIFWINPIAALAVVPTTLALVRASERPEPGAGRIDLLGAVLLGAGLAALIGGLHDFAAVAIILGVVLLAGFLVYERRSDDPLIDFAMLRKRPIISALSVVALTQGVVTFGAIFLADYMQTVLGFSPAAAGAALIPATAMLLLGSILGGRITDRVGPRIPGAVGCVAAIAGLLWLALLLADERYAILVPGLLVFGFALSLAGSPMQVTVLNLVAADERAAASGLLGTCRQIGGSLGLALLSGVLAVRSADHGLVDGLEWALIVGAGFIAAALATLVLLMPAGLVRSEN